jgi:hypothetical protein
MDEILSPELQQSAHDQSASVNTEMSFAILIFAA